MNIIKGFTAASNHLYGPSPIVPSGNVATIGLQFLLSEEWDDLTVSLVIHKCGLTYQQTLNDDGTVAIPAGVMESTGSFELALAGYTMDGEQLVQRLSTNRISGRVIDGAYIAGMTPAPGHDDPSDWERMLDHLVNYLNPHQVTAEQVGAYTKAEADNLLAGKAATGEDAAFKDVSANAVTVDGGDTVLGNRALTFSNGGIVRGLQTPVLDGDAAPKGYVDAIADDVAELAEAVAGKLDADGGIVSGSFAMVGSADVTFDGGTYIGQSEVRTMSASFTTAIVLTPPTANTDIANKKYVDDQIAEVPGAVVDTAMSDTSEHAVQNKVIKSYFDDRIGQIADETTIFSKNFLNMNDPDYLPNHTAGSTTGQPVESSTLNLTGFVAVVPGNNIVVSRGRVGPSVDSRLDATSQVQFFSYSSDKSYIARTIKVEDYYTVPDGVGFLRVAIPNSTAFTNYMIEKSTTISTEYEEYFASHPYFTINPERVLNVPLSKQENDAGFITGDDILYKAPIALPSTIYAFAGVPISMYFYNITPYQPDDIYLRFSNLSASKGKIKSRCCWEYTPASAERITLMPIIVNHDYRTLNDNESFVLDVKDSTVKSSLTCLVIGDSTVEHGYETQKMLDLATTDGYPLTLIGTRGSGTNRHEGRSGWTADMYVNDAGSSRPNAFYNPTTQKFDFAYYMAQQGYDGVDCVFIQLGINDVFSAKTDSGLAEKWQLYYPNVDYIIESIRSYDSEIKIVVNTLIPCDTDQDAFGDAYGVSQEVWRNHRNVYLTNLNTIDRYKNIENLYVSPYCMALDCDNNMAGDVHPNQDGYNQLGAQMYGFARAIN